MIIPFPLVSTGYTHALHVYCEHSKWQFLFLHLIYLLYCFLHLIGLLYSLYVSLSDEGPLAFTLTFYISNYCIPKLAVGELSVAVYSEETLSLSKMYHNFHELS